MFHHYTAKIIIIIIYAIKFTILLFVYIFFF